MTMNENEVKAFIADFNSLSPDYQRVIFALIQECAAIQKAKDVKEGGVNYD